MALTEKLFTELVDAIASRTAEKILAALSTRESRAESAREPILLRTEDAVTFLGLSTQTLRNWRSMGQGPQAVTRGSLVRYRHVDLEEWAEAEFTPR